MLPALEKSWGVKVGFADDCIGAPAEAAKAALQNGQVTLLENVRFHAEEEKMIWVLPNKWRRSVKFTATMLSLPRTALMPQPKDSRTSCQPARVF